MKYFLAPMQDGEFMEGETMHPIGKAIMVFAGGTSNTYQEFANLQSLNNVASPQSESEAQVKLTGQDLKDAKVPDFISRLRGYVNILGPNPVDSRDYVYLIRRAVILRQLLMDKAEHLFENTGEMRINHGVLRALLKVPEYKHGVRSMEAILDMSLLSNRKVFEQAALPPKEQLELHADAEMFSRLVAQDVLTIKAAIDSIAKAIHENYRRLHEEKSDRSRTDTAMRPWDTLPEEMKRSNRRQAEHIPVKLRAVSCDFKLRSQEGQPAFEFTPKAVEKLAEMEHERWIEERILSGWRAGPRDHSKKTTPYLVPWHELDDETKDNDRAAVRGMARFMAEAGFEIYRSNRNG